MLEPSFVSKAGEVVRASALACAAGLLGLAMTAAAHARGAPETFADLADRLSPAVVNVSTAQSVPGGAGGLPVPEEFKDWFEGQDPERITSLGSGFVIDASGLIVTNYHVIEGADEIHVNFLDGESLKATLIGRDELTDLALLRVTPNAKRPLVATRFGNSESMRVGDWVVAIGNPFGLGGSVTAGIISAFNRDIQAGPYDDFIQTDAAINRGNSGGPLFNLNGDVIGINTAIYSPTGGSVGIGFAIPSNIAANVVDQLKRYGETRRGWIGVRIQTVTPAIAESIGLPEPKGALITDVTPGGPAAKAGLQAGDAIVKFDSKDVPNMRALPRLVAETQIGKTVKVEAFRQSKVLSFNVTIERLEGQGQRVSSADDEFKPRNAPVTQSSDVLGLKLAPLTPSLRRKYGIPERVEGVVVVGVDPTSPAAGEVTEGDVISEVQYQKVVSPSDVANSVAKAKQVDKKVVLMNIHRGDQSRFEGVPIQKR